MLLSTSEADSRCRNGPCLGDSQDKARRSSDENSRFSSLPSRQVASQSDQEGAVSELPTRHNIQ